RWESGENGGGAGRGNNCARESAAGLCGCRGRRSGRFVLALRVGTLPHGAGFEPLLHHVRAAAFGTFLGDRFAPRYELTIGILVTTVKCFALAGTAFD